MRRFVAALILAGLASLCLSQPSEAVAAPIAAQNSSTDVLKAVQSALRARGYATAVDGHYSVRTTAALKAWQKANGFKITGMVNPATLKSLGLGSNGEPINGPAVAVASAERVPVVEIGTPPTVPVTGSGLRGMPFAPRGLDLCAEMAWYANQAGLPDAVNVRDGTGGFDSLPTKEQATFAEQAIGRRESGCNNSSANSCCGGWYGIAWSNLNAPGYRPFTSAYCESHTRDDIVGPSALQKQHQACVAKVIYSYWLGHPGQPWPWRL